MAKSYWEKLQDPRWQKKRLEVMEKCEFSCQLCGENQKTLNVHHKEYFKGFEPWEYEENQLIVLCKDCHENQHSEVDLYKWVGSFANLDGLNNRQELAIVLCGYIGYPLKNILYMAGIEFNSAIERYYESGKCAKLYQQHLLEESKKGKKNA